MIKAIFSDIDGVIFFQGDKFSLRYSKQFNLPIELFDEFFDKDMDFCFVGKKDLKEALAKYLDSWKWKGSVEDLLNYWFDEKYEPSHMLIDLFKEYKVSGINIYLTTQNDKYRTDTFLTRLKPILKYDRAFSTCTIGFKKSNPQYFLTCLEKCNFKPEEVLLIDNSEKAINSAKSVGINTVFFESEKQAIAEIKTFFP